MKEGAFFKRKLIEDILKPTLQVMELIQKHSLIWMYFDIRIGCLVKSKEIDKGNKEVNDKCEASLLHSMPFWLLSPWLIKLKNA